MGKCKISQAWWYTPLIAILGDLSRWDQKFKASLRNREFQNSQGYARACLNLPHPPKKITLLQTKLIVYVFAQLWVY